MLEFTVDIDGVIVNGVDMIKWNADGKIVEFEDIQIVGPDEVTGDMRITTGSVSFGVLDDLMADSLVSTVH